MEDCIFCNIVHKKIPAAIFFEDAHTVAFFDIHPISLGHTLVIPKKHARHFLHMNDQDVESLAKTARHIGARLTEKLEAQGMNLSMNCESTAGQVVFHTHMHVIPRYSDAAAADTKKYSTDELLALMSQ